MKVLIVTTLCTASLMAASPEMDAYMQQLQADAAKPFDARRGEAVFTSEHIGKKGKTIACTACHTADLSAKGRNAHTGKEIAPLSPKADPSRLQTVKEVKKWLRRNFKDVYNREGTPQEKGDVLTYILQY